MQHEISFGFFWKCLRKCWLIMIIAALVVSITVGIFVSFIPKNYSSSIDFYVVNTNTSYDYTTSALLAASSYLINDYIEIIRSNRILDLVAEELNKNKPENEHVTADKLRGMISASSNNTSVFTIKVTHTDPEYAYEVASAIKEIAPKEVTEVAKPDRLTNENLYNAILQVVNQNKPESEQLTMEQLKEQLKIQGLNSSLPCFEAINPPVVDKSPDSPSIKKYAFYAAVATAALVYAIFVIKGLLEMNISSEDDVKKLVRRPLVGTIPHWENSAKK